MISDEGAVLLFDFTTHKLLWSQRVSEEPLQICQNEGKVFAITSQSEGSVFIIDQLNGSLIHTIENAHPLPIFGVAVHENILATAGLRGIIKFHDTGALPKCELLFEKRVFTRHDFTHLDKAEFPSIAYLISGATNGEVIVWNFKTGEQLKTLDSGQRIMTLKVKWPLVATCSFNCLSNSAESGNQQ